MTVPDRTRLTDKVQKNTDESPCFLFFAFFYVLNANNAYEYGYKAHQGVLYHRKKAVVEQSGRGVVRERGEEKNCRGVTYQSKKSVVQK